MSVELLGEIFSPAQIVMVVVIALVVFGPQKLPEIAKQMGSAIRDLKKAGSDMMSQLNTDHEPDYPGSYGSSNGYNGYNSYNGYDSGYSSGYTSGYSYPGDVGAPVDLTDYTIVGRYVPQPPKMPQVDLSDYSIAPSANKKQEPAGSTDAPAA
jgi:TatA/E family protein of Tat protein translocase